MREKIPEGWATVNTTSWSSEPWSRAFSPYSIGPVKTYAGISKKLENVWSYAGVYQEYADDNGNPTEEYFKFLNESYNSKCKTYPLGKDKKPLYYLWDGQRMNLVEFRKKVIIPTYVEAIKDTPAFERLRTSKVNVALWDFFSYNHKKLNLTYEQVINNEKKMMGHSFIIAMMIDGFLGKKYDKVL